MKKQKNSDLDKYLVDDVACAYETRIPEGHSSRDWAFLPFGIGILLCGMGVFMAHDAAVGKVVFWSNPVVLFGVGLALYCTLVGLSMFFGRWRWTAIQMALMGLCTLAIYYAFPGASLAGIFLYGSASLEIKTLVFLLSFCWSAYWVFVTVRGCRAIWADKLLRQSVWVNYKHAVVYRQFGAKMAMEKIGVKIHPNNLIMALSFLLILPLAWWRKELSVLFGVPFIHIVGILGQSVMVMCLILPVIGLILMVYYPIKIQRTTGKPVLLDMMAPAKAPIPSQEN